MAVAVVAPSSRDAHFESAVRQLRVGVQAMAAWVRQTEGEALGEGLIQIREAGIDPLEAVFATGVRRFDESGEYKADGALSLTAWLRWKVQALRRRRHGAGRGRPPAREVAADRGGVRQRRCRVSARRRAGADGRTRRGRGGP